MFIPIPAKETFSLFYQDTNAKPMTLDHKGIEVFIRSVHFDYQHHASNILRVVTRIAVDGDLVEQVRLASLPEWDTMGKSGDMAFFRSFLMIMVEQALYKYFLPESFSGHIVDEYLGMSDSYEILNAIKPNPLPSDHGPNTRDIARRSRNLPGMDTNVHCPADLVAGMCGHRGNLWGVIQHLNDEHKWNREKIADWIDELHDAGTINAEFSPWGSEEPAEKDKVDAYEVITSKNAMSISKSALYHVKNNTEYIIETKEK